jgi:AraC-like DNA-binding protein
LRFSEYPLFNERRQAVIDYKMFKPHGVLAHFVRFFWNLEAQVDGSCPFVHRALPDNCIEVIFYCKGDLSITSRDGDEGKTFSSGIFGQAQKFRQFKTNRDFSLFGVYIYPYALNTLFNVPPSNVCNEKVDSETLLGLSGKILEEQVMLAGTFAQRIQIVSNFLLDRIRKITSYDQTFIRHIRSVVDSNSLHSITTFADQCNLSRRQFERKFKEHSGFSPKDFFKVVRFKNVVKEAEERHKSLAQIAIDNGYYDQSHFTNEFKMFSGYNPKEFFINYPEAVDARVIRDFKI